MKALLIPLALILLSIPLVLALVRANEIAYLAVRGGRIRMRRGRLPSKLLLDLGDVLERPPVDGSLRIVVENRAPRVYAEGEISVDQKQRIRNVLGAWPLARLRAR